jgi:hypothetical protein
VTVPAKFLRKADADLGPCATRVIRGLPYEATIGGTAGVQCDHLPSQHGVDEGFVPMDLGGLFLEQVAIGPVTFRNCRACRCLSYNRADPDARPGTP